MDSFTHQLNNSTVAKHITDILQRCCSANVLKLYHAVDLQMPYNASFIGFLPHLCVKIMLALNIHVILNGRGSLRAHCLSLHEQGSKDLILLADNLRDTIINQKHLKIFHSLLYQHVSFLLVRVILSVLTQNSDFK